MTRSLTRRLRRSARASRVVLLMCVAGGMLGAASSAGASAITAPVTRMVALRVPARFRGVDVHVQLGSFTANGDLWLAVRPFGVGSTTLLLVDPRTGREVERVSAGMVVTTAMVVGPDGDAWFAGYDSKSFDYQQAEVGSVSAAGRVRRFRLPARFTTAVPGLVSVAAGPGGEVWFTGEELHEVAVGHVSLAGRVVITQFPEFFDWDSGLVATPLGRLYSVGEGDSGVVPVQLPLVGTRVTRVAAPYTLESSDEAGDVLGWGENRPARTTPGGSTRYYNWRAGSGVTGEVFPGAITQGSDSSLWFTASGSDDQVGSQGTDVPTNPVLGRIEADGRVTTWPTTVVGTDQSPLGDQLDGNHDTPVNQDALEPGPDGRLYAVGSPVSPNTTNVEQIGPLLPWHLYETTLPGQPVMRAPKVRLVSARRSGDHVTVRLSCTAQPGRYCAGTITVIGSDVIVTQSYADTPGMVQTYTLHATDVLGRGAPVVISSRDPETGKTTIVQGHVA